MIRSTVTVYRTFNDRYSNIFVLLKTGTIMSVKQQPYLWWRVVCRLGTSNGCGGKVQQQWLSASAPANAEKDMQTCLFEFECHKIRTNTSLSCFHSEYTVKSYKIFSVPPLSSTSVASILEIPCVLNIAISREFPEKSDKTRTNITFNCGPFFYILIANCYKRSMSMLKVWYA